MVGGRGVNSRVPCQSLQSVTLAGIRGFPVSTGVHLRLVAEGGMGKSWGEPWMLYKAEGREGGWKRGRNSLSREEKWGYPPFIIASSGRKAYKC